MFKRIGDKARQRIFLIASAILVAVVAIMSVKIGLQNDTFYTIKVGEHIMQHGIDGIDPFSYHNLPYTYPHWLFDVTIYSIYHVFGFAGIYFVTCILAVALGLLIYYVCSRLSHNKIAAFIVTLISLVLLNGFLTARAQLVSYILLLLAVYFIERFLSTGHKRYAIGLVIIPAIIANVHAAVYPFYFILFMPYIAAGLAGNFICRRRQVETTTILGRLVISQQPRTKWLLLIVVLALIAGLATPIGLTPYTYAIKSALGTTMSYIAEHQPTVLAATTLFTVTIILSILILIFTRQKIRLSDCLMVGGLFLMALSSNRHIALLALIGTIPATKYLAELLQSKNANGRQIANRFALLTAGLAAASAAICTMALVVLAPKLESKMISKDTYPVEAAKFIKSHIDLKKARFYNPYFIGSYLLYNDIPVFIDSRADVYDPKFHGDKNKDVFMDEHYLNTLTHTYYEDIFKKYKITHALVDKNSPIDLQLAHNNRYKKIYSDDNFVIYRRK